jgi:ATP-binding cassette subfamily B protein
MNERSDIKSGKKEKREKLSILRLMKNVAYVLRYAVKLNKTLFVLILLAHILLGAVYALFDTVFVKLFIEFISDEAKDFAYVLTFTLISIAVLGLGQAFEAFMDNWVSAKFIKTAGRLQQDFLRKAADIDLICYDHKEYFDDFVIAAAQSEDMMISGIMSTAWICGNITTIATLGIVIFAVSPFIAIFPVVGFLVNMVTRFAITKAEYNYDIESKRIMRKADYSRRVFYQPEYAKEIRLSDIEVPLRRQFEEAIGEVTKEADRAGRKIAVLSLINWISVFTLLSFFCIPMYLGYLAIVKLAVSFGEVAAMNNAAASLRSRLDTMNYAMVEFQKVGQYAERFRRFIEYDIRIEGRRGINPVPDGKAVLEIRNMSFCYEGSDKNTLQNISMTVKPGEKIAIVGENGAGKTTFVKLLMRLYDVTGGSICYGGKDIRTFSTKEYRDIFGAVFQDYQLYGTSLAENVLMDKADKARDGENDRIINALKLADFGKKLDRLPGGTDTQLTREFDDEGTVLSGGEAQKVAIARMFAKAHRMSVAILDEPSSALDPFAEYTLNRNMIESAKDAAVIFISHRLSTTRDADRIYLFENGEIIEQGSHEELMRRNGKYALMFEKQAYYYRQEIAGEAGAERSECASWHRVPYHGRLRT